MYEMYFGVSLGLIPQLILHVYFIIAYLGEGNNRAYRKLTEIVSES